MISSLPAIDSNPRLSSFEQKPKTEINSVSFTLDHRLLLQNNQSISKSSSTQAFAFNDSKLLLLPFKPNCDFVCLCLQSTRISINKSQSSILTSLYRPSTQVTLLVNRFSKSKTYNQQS